MRVNETDLAWASGLFVGEGCVGRSISRNSSGKFEYIHVQIGMYDERAIKRFAETFGVNYGTIFLKHCSHIFHKVSVRGRPAERIIGLMWPFIRDTEKGDQAMRYAKKLDVEAWITGEDMGQRPQLNRMKRGRKVA